MADAAGGGQFMRLVRVGAKEAKAFLDKNTDNRPVRSSHVRELAIEMTQGRWMLTGDPLRFATDGRMLDGQHRCHAVVRASEVMTKRGVADFAIDMWACFNVPHETMGVIDTGYKRTVADGLVVFDGVDGAIAKRVSSISRVIYVLDTGYSRPDIGLQDARAVLDAYGPDISWSVESMRSQDKFSVATLGAALAYSHSTHPEQVEAAVHALKDPQVPVVGQLRLMRDYIVAGRAGRGGSGVRTAEACMFLNAMYNVCVPSASAKGVQMKTTHDGKPIMRGYDFFRRERERKGLRVLARAQP